MTDMTNMTNKNVTKKCHKKTSQKNVIYELNKCYIQNVIFKWFCLIIIITVTVCLFSILFYLGRSECWLVGRIMFS